MRLVVDSQLPKRLARWFGTRGFDALHTLDLEQGNRSPDAELERLLERNFPAIASALQANSFVELGRDKLIVHG